MAGIILLTIVTIMVSLYMKRGGDDWSKKQGGENDTLGRNIVLDFLA